jgi:hypothetical protein
MTRLGLGRRIIAHTSIILHIGYFYQISYQRDFSSHHIQYWTKACTKCKKGERNPKTRFERRDQRILIGNFLQSRFYTRTFELQSDQKYFLHGINGRESTNKRQYRKGRFGDKFPQKTFIFEKFTFKSGRKR